MRSLDWLDWMKRTARYLRVETTKQHWKKVKQNYSRLYSRRCFTLDLWQTKPASSSKIYAYNTSMRNAKFNVLDASRRSFPEFLRAQNMVRVIEGKII